ncbi:MULTISPECIES: hypothetical protein [Pseudanabaena]|uniref:hypothetical protein n=1 Tax=Pseudanabaena TaxID=1152 RepID=UPI00247B02E7|nr:MULTISPECIES: hypothetical protein [Pseudanabaena]MEA5487799.1 hypothetical protein [Pseudanabaena sp. CCNP1317]WGS74463.1 hypothetical protein OA858_10660 [Pseudanabaena galeata CCNP1313]
MDYWIAAICVYVSLASVTLIPSIRNLIGKVPLHPGGSSFSDSDYFSEHTRKQLEQHFTRIQGTLRFWKKKAVIYTSFHYYCVVWTILSSWAVPLIGAITPQDGNSNAKWLLVTISSHVALSLSFHRGLKVAEGMKAFRLGESEFYDLYRRLLDSPKTFGDNEEKQIEQYFAEVARIRKLVRSAETDSLPDVESIKAIT